MMIPPGLTEQDVQGGIDRALGLLAPMYVFGYYDTDDIKQIGWEEALKVLQKEVYDPSRPFENFIYSHLRNRLSNLKRNQYRRNDPPCKPCHRGEWCGPEQAPCEKYHIWKTRNAAKANLMRPVHIGGVAETEQTGGHSRPLGDADAETAELLRLIDEQLLVELRATWKQMLDGCRVPKDRRDLIESRIREILGGTWPASNEED